MHPLDSTALLALQLLHLPSTAPYVCAAGRSNGCIVIICIHLSRIDPSRWLLRVFLDERTASCAPPSFPLTDWQLIISRLVLYDVTLDPPTGTSGASKGPKGPLLWPLNAFKFVGTALVLQDVRLVIRSTALFKQYLDFFKAQPALQSDTSTTLHTVRA